MLAIVSLLLCGCAYDDSVKSVLEEVASENNSCLESYKRYYLRQNTYRGVFRDNEDDHLLYDFQYNTETKELLTNKDLCIKVKDIRFVLEYFDDTYCVIYSKKSLTDKEAPIQIHVYSINEDMESLYNTITEAVRNTGVTAKIYVYLPDEDVFEANRDSRSLTLIPKYIDDSYASTLSVVDGVMQTELKDMLFSIKLNNLIEQFG